MANPDTAFGLSVGDEIELIKMGEDPHPIARGTRGRVTSLCTTPGLEQIMVQWENGRSLALIPSEDTWRRC